MQKYLRPQVKMGTMLVSWLCVLWIAILEKGPFKVHCMVIKFITNLRGGNWTRHCLWYEGVGTQLWSGGATKTAKLWSSSKDTFGISWRRQHCWNVSLRPCHSIDFIIFTEKMFSHPLLNIVMAENPTGFFVVPEKYLWLKITFC